MENDKIVRELIILLQPVIKKCAKVLQIIATAISIGFRCPPDVSFDQKPPCFSSNLASVKVCIHFKMCKMLLQNFMSLSKIYFTLCHCF